jgi:hypothetical protein
MLSSWSASVFHWTLSISRMDKVRPHEPLNFTCIDFQMLQTIWSFVQFFFLLGSDCTVFAAYKQMHGRRFRWRRKRFALSTDHSGSEVQSPFVLDTSKVMILASNPTNTYNVFAHFSSLLCPIQARPWGVAIPREGTLAASLKCIISFQN